MSHPFRISVATFNRNLRPSLNPSERVNLLPKSSYYLEAWIGKAPLLPTSPRQQLVIAEWGQPSAPHPCLA